MKNNQNHELIDRLQEFLNGDGVHMDFDEETETLTGNLELAGGMRRGRLQIFALRNGMIMRCSYPLGADIRSAESLARVSEFVNRCNFALPNGNFELDYSDGEVAYKLFHDCTDGLPSDRLLRRSLASVSLMMDTYADGLAQTVFTKQPIKEIVAECENDEHRLRCLREDDEDEPLPFGDETDDTPDQEDDLSEQAAEKALEELRENLRTRLMAMLEARAREQAETAAQEDAEE